MRFSVYGRTDVGRKRNHNEDAFAIYEEDSLFVLADGMGGHGGGEVASAVAVDTVAQFALYAMPWMVQPDDESETALLEQLGDALSQCQDRLRQVALRKHIDQLKPGTTLTLAYALWPKLYVAHAGDSRLNLHRGSELTQITSDNTVGQTLRDQGAMGEGPSRFDHILVNVVGGGGDEVSAEAHAVTLESGDKVLLCSDGLTGHVSDSQIEAVLSKPISLASACEELIEAAKADGGYDNITVVIASF